MSSAYGFIDRSRERKQASRLGDALNLKRGSIDDPVSTLSGGNQQKVAIAKMLSVDPKVILLDEPTRGVDVGAKAEIHRILRDLANQRHRHHRDLLRTAGTDRPVRPGDRHPRGAYRRRGRRALTMTEENIIRLASGAGVGGKGEDMTVMSDIGTGKGESGAAARAARRCCAASATCANSAWC